MHALSLGTWWIHLTSVLEWIVAMLAVQQYGRQRGEGGWRWLSLAMVPALASAMAACTWHLFDNSEQLQGLVVLQAGLTTLGNLALAVAAWNLLRQQGQAAAAPTDPATGPASAAGGPEPASAAAPPPALQEPQGRQQPFAEDRPITSPLPLTSPGPIAGEQRLAREQL